MTEVISGQKKVLDNKLVHVGVGILQQSKLLFLRFVQFLREFLKEGSYVPVYAGKFNFFIVSLRKNFLFVLKLNFQTLTLCAWRFQTLKVLAKMSHGSPKCKKCFSQSSKRVD